MGDFNCDRRHHGSSDTFDCRLGRYGVSFSSFFFLFFFYSCMLLPSVTSHYSPMRKEQTVLCPCYYSTTTTTVPSTFLVSCFLFLVMLSPPLISPSHFAGTRLCPTRANLSTCDGHERTEGSRKRMNVEEKIRESKKKKMKMGEKEKKREKMKRKRGETRDTS